MKKFKELLLLNQAIIIYFLSIIVSIILLPFLSKIYYILYKPNLLISGLYIISEPKLELYIGGFFVGCFLFVSFFTSLFIEKKNI